jgi:non-ribosomal peptide synthetase component F
LLDFVDDLASAKRQFLVHDDGFRARRHSCATVGCAARGFEWDDGAPPLAAIGCDDAAEIVFTSGATGEPTGVVIGRHSWFERDEARRASWAAPAVKEVEDHIAVVP